MKSIKHNISNENVKFESIFQGNNINQHKNLQNNHMNTNYNSSIKTEFRKTTINFKNFLNKESNYKYIQNPMLKRITGKNQNNNRMKLKLRYMNNNLSNLNSYLNKDILKPYINDSAIPTVHQKRNIFSLSNKQKMKNVYHYITNSKTLNDTSGRTFLRKYNKTMTNMLETKEKDNDVDNPVYLKTENNLYVKEKINDETKFKYSTLLKNLDSWDKEHCDQKMHKTDANLYNYLSNYYQKNNLMEDYNNLLFASNILNVRKNYTNLIEKGKQNNKIFIDMIKRKQKEAGTILNNTLYRAKVKYSDLFNRRYYKDFSENLDIDSETLNLLIEKEIKNVFYNKIIKDRIKYENELHDELIKVNSMIYNKKNLKDEKTRRLKELYKEKLLLEKEFNETYSKNRKTYWYRYDNYQHHYNRLITKSTKDLNELTDGNDENNENDENNKNNEEENKINENDKRKSKYRRTKTSVYKNNKISFLSPSPKKKNKNRLSTIKRKVIKEIEYEKNFKLLNMNNEMNSQLKLIKDNYHNKFENINEEQKELENDVRILKNELEFFKKINDELIREYKLYYLEKLKKGYDCRKDGLVWVVCNLLELQIPLENRHFPKYLTPDQIDYLKEYAKLQLKQNELKIIINVLKKKQNTQKMNDVLRCMDVIDNILDLENKNEEEDVDNLTINYNYNRIKNKDFIVAKNKINKKFVKIYQDNAKVMKNYLNKNKENYDFYQVIDELKKDLYYGSNSANKKSKRDILNVFMGDNKNKDFFQFLMDIKSNFEHLEEEKEKLFESQKQSYLKLVDNALNNKGSDIIVIKNEMIKRCLFGTRLDN
jgi:hypothetical protein